MKSALKKAALRCTPQARRHGADSRDSPGCGRQFLRGKRRLRNSAGFALLQALLAVMILSLGLVALMAAFQHALRLTQLRRNCLTPARELAEQVLANLERGASLATPENNMTWSAEQNRLPCQISTSPWPVVPGLQQVRVAVSWMDHGKPGTVTLTTLLPDTVGAQAHAVNANQ